MPCTHFEVKIRKRSSGQSAVAGAAYQSGETLFSEYDQEKKSYASKNEVLYTEILLPDNAPKEYADRQTLWNAVEAKENQWDAQLARGIIMALPRESVRTDALFTSSLYDTFCSGKKARCEKYTG